jgi:hypothetical protein
VTDFYKSLPTVPVNIEMPLPVYDGFVDKCDQSSREYAILKNGLIIRRPKGDHFERIVEIACDMDDADKLFLLASRVYPEALENIIKAIAQAKSDWLQQHTITPLPQRSSH